MNSQEEKRRKTNNQPPEGLESPFLEGEFFAGEVDEEWEARLGALEAESIFQRAFEESSAPVAEPEVYEEEWANEGEETEADTLYAKEDLEEEQDITLEELYEAPIESEVFGTNDMDSVANTLDVPHRWICRLDIEYEITPWNTTRMSSGHGTGTGTLISPCHVLTAAHNITQYDPVQKNYLKAVRIKVTAAHDGSARPPIMAVDVDLSRSNVHPRWRVRSRVGSGGAPNPAGEVETNRYDYALLTLKSSIGRVPVKALGNCPLGYWAKQVSCGFAHFERLDPNVLRNHKASIAGYAYDACVVAVRSARSNPNIPSGGQLVASGGLSLIWEGTKTRYVSQSMAHDVDTCGGQSGAPVWIKRNGIYYLVAIHTGAVGLTGGGRTNHAVRVTRGLIRQVNQWITKTRCPEQVGNPEREDILETETPYTKEEFEDYEDEKVDEHEWKDEAAPDEFDEVYEDKEYAEEDSEEFEEIELEYNINELDDFDEEQYDEQFEEPNDSYIGKLDLREYLVISPVTHPTLGFEFDVHFGLLEEVVTHFGKAMLPDGARITNHDDLVEGFHVKLDGPRFEIATKPFEVTDSGRNEMNQTLNEILKFAKELNRGCINAPQITIAIPGVAGKPKPFTHPKTLVAGLPIVKLPLGGKFPTCSVWASPQATITIPLSKVSAFIREVKKSEGKDPGIALTGDTRHRMGLRSEALYKALKEVNNVWKELVEREPKLTLSDGTIVDRQTFTDNFRGFLILLASYLWTSELPYHFADPKPKDYEPFAKAYLPVNVKAPFSEIYRELLTPTERLLFKEIFADGSARLRLFRLAKRNATLADGSKKLFPPGPKESLPGGIIVDSVHDRQKDEFGPVPTWNDLVEHTLNPGHKGWGDRLLECVDIQSNRVMIAPTRMKER